MDITRDVARGSRIRALREEAGLSQAELAEKLNVSRVAVTKYETGETNPARSLKKLSNLFNVSVDYLLNGEEPYNIHTSNLRIGDTIRQLRESKKLPKSALAALCDVTTRAVTSWENNITQPSLDTITKLAQLFNVSTDYILRVESKEDIPDDYIPADGLIEELYADSPDILEKLKDIKFFQAHIGLTDVEKAVLKSTLDVVLRSRGVI